MKRQILSSVTQDDDGRQADDVGRQFVGALARGLEVLSAFARRDDALGNNDIVAKTGLPGPTVSRLTYTLTRVQYLDYDSRSGKYSLGIRALALGYRAMSGRYIQRAARPFMEEASKRFNICTALGYRDGLDVVYLEHTHGASGLILDLAPGSRTPAVTTALGRALLMTMPAAEREAFIAESTRYLSHPAQVKMSLKNAQKDYEKNAFVLSLGEWEPDVNAVGVPLRLSGPDMPMALTMGGSAHRFSPEMLREEIGPFLVELAGRIARSVSAEN